MPANDNAGAIRFGASLRKHISDEAADRCVIEIEWQ